ncbi:regulator of G-protein signaling 21-like [Salarias fasciatus]|uniref:Regulator of G-protein signaling 21-like n=1 Tax=Salarias fasciatus TaxID=181472 RepID=A0A672HGY5_SALFA|nr:regulator of G-protein signaling 21-like [Salarias fasciatus]
MSSLCKTSPMDFQDSKRIDIAWKSRIHTLIQSPLPWTKTIRQETNEASLLGDSLETFLSKKSGQTAFWEFLKSEFCEESLDFWLACEDFKTCDSPEERTQRAAVIYEEFVRDDSPKQVNLDFYTRDIISQSLLQPSQSCFDVAQRKIYSLMENGAFPRFLQSEQYKLSLASTLKQRGLGKSCKASRKMKAGGVIQRDSKAVVLWNDLCLLQKD